MFSLIVETIKKSPTNYIMTRIHLKNRVGFRLAQQITVAIARFFLLLHFMFLSLGNY